MFDNAFNQSNLVTNSCNYAHVALHGPSFLAPFEAGHPWYSPGEAQCQGLWHVAPSGSASASKQPDVGHCHGSVSRRFVSLLYAVTRPDEPEGDEWLTRTLHVDLSLAWLHVSIRSGARQCE